MALPARVLVGVGVPLSLLAPWMSFAWIGSWFGPGEPPNTWSGLTLLLRRGDTVIGGGFVLPIRAFDPMYRARVEAEVLLALWIALPLAAVSVSAVPSRWPRTRLLSSVALLLILWTLVVTEAGQVRFQLQLLLVPALIAGYFVTIAVARPRWTKGLGVLLSCVGAVTSLVDPLAWGALVALLLGTLAFWLECLQWERLHAPPFVEGAVAPSQS